MWFYFVWISAWFVIITTPSTKTQTDDVTTNGVCYGFNMLGSTHLFFMCMCFFSLHFLHTIFFGCLSSLTLFLWHILFWCPLSSRGSNTGKKHLHGKMENMFDWKERVQCIFLVNEKLLRFSILFSVCRHWCGHKKGQKNQRETEIWQIMLFK